MAPTPRSIIGSSKASLVEIQEAVEVMFKLPDSELLEATQLFRDELDEGLANYGHDVAMVPSFVTGVPNGSETGTFLALDLGGTNLRVCEVKLLGNHQFEIKQQKYKVSEELKQGQATTLFDYIADSVDGFLTDISSEFANGNSKDLRNEPLYLGFTFSFPVEQTALDAGKLLTWTKGFAAKNAVGHDVVKLLQDSLDRKHIHVRCVALVNDTVGTLLSRSYQNGPALIGAIFGTGTNGAYIDRVRTVKKLGEEKIAQEEAGGPEGGEWMVVNTEWGAFDNRRRCLPVSVFDNKLDRQSINPRKQAFEKMVSGMYLGEITRNIILHLVDTSLLFNGYSSPLLNTHYGFDAAFVSKILGAKDDVEVRKAIVTELHISVDHISADDIETIRWACRIVSSRAAQLAAVALAAIIQHTEKNRSPEDLIDVGLDGSVAEYLPNFVPHVRDALRTILGEETEKKVTMGMARDGSGVGAALTALQAKKAIDNRRAAAAKAKAAPVSL